MSFGIGRKSIIYIRWQIQIIVPSIVKCRLDPFCNTSGEASHKDHFFCNDVGLCLRVIKIHLLRIFQKLMDRFLPISNVGGIATTFLLERFRAPFKSIFRISLGRTSSILRWPLWRRRVLSLPWRERFLGLWEILLSLLRRTIFTIGLRRMLWTPTSE